MKFIHTADLHLDAPLTGTAFRSAVRRSMLQVLEQIIEYAHTHSIPHVVIAGDLFDSPTPSAVMLGTVREMMERASEQFWIAPGNHDRWVQDRYLGITWPENVHVFGKEIQCVTTPEGVFVGAGFYEGMSEHPLRQLSLSEPMSVGVFHGSLGDTTPAYRIDESALRQSGLGYVALGHIHKAADPTYVGGTLVATCGSPLSHGFDEPGQRSFLVVEMSAGGITWNRVATDSVRFYEEEICLEENLSSADILGKLMVSAAKYKEKDIFRFRLTGKTACALPTALEEYPALAEIIDETTLPLSVGKLAQEQSLRGYFVSGMLEKMAAADEAERAKYEAALRLGLEAFE